MPLILDTISTKPITNTKYKTRAIYQTKLQPSPNNTMSMPSGSAVSPTKPVISFDEPSHPRRQPASNAVSTPSSPWSSSRALSFATATSSTSVSLPEQLPSNTWSRATSFSGELPHQPRTRSPLALTRAISFETPGEHLEGSSRWNKEKEERLNEVETKCRELQRRWSEEQHKYVDEVCLCGSLLFLVIEGIDKIGTWTVGGQRLDPDTRMKWIAKPFPAWFFELAIRRSPSPVPS
jgi:hypothetical protein